MRLLMAWLLLLAGLVVVPRATLSGAGFEALWPDAAAIETYLREAKVTARKAIGTGVTRPDKVTLELDGVVRSAVFKRPEKPHDHWRYELGAYALDKLLELGHVPPTVERSLRGEPGCLQLWVDGVTMVAQTEPPPDLDAWREQVSVMWLFDDLAGNIDRHLNNAIITPQFGLAFIDNSRSFSDKTVLINDLNRRATGTQARYWFEVLSEARPRFPVTYPPRVVERLRTVTDKEIQQAIGRYVPPQRVRALLERRKSIVGRLEEIQPVRVAEPVGAR
jgi:hypothetical protein